MHGMKGTAAMGGSRIATLLLSVLILFALGFGCGSTGVATEDPLTPPDTAGAGGGEDNDGGEVSPVDGPEISTYGDEEESHDPLDGIWLFGVNNIDFDTTDEGVSMESEDTAGDDVPVGGFNGGGTGNKAFVGLHGYDGVSVDSVYSIVVNAALDSGESFFYLNMQIDCDGDGAWSAVDDGIVVVDSDSLPAFDLPVSGEFVEIDIDPGDAVFKMVGGPKASCGDLPSHLSHGVEKPLTDLPASALFFNGSTGDGGMPNDEEMAAILFVMGDSGSRDARSITIESIVVNDDEYVLH